MGVRLVRGRLFEESDEHGVTNDMTDKVSAIDLVKAAVAELGGVGGGGRPDMAQGGGKDAANAPAAIAAAEAVIGG